MRRARSSGAPGVKVPAAYPTSRSRSAGTTSSAARCTPRSSTTRAGRARYGDRQRRPARRLRGHPEGPQEHVEDVLFNRRADATERISRSRRRSRRGDADAKRTSRGGKARSRSGSLTRSSTASTVDRGGHGGGPAAVRAAARGDRGTAHGRDADRRRPVRRREDVPSPGREVRARDEEGGRLPRALHGGGEGRLGRSAPRKAPS